ncbi:unnamed protein product [Protopolystoma xenopodis]|uniref:Uncharacterized protein n=1 Tax=Protopolystoma xenopodis TaxID=117903 RepID=A0A3S5BPA8_9PLAT|nr:unnamed protein product [Protopolystoma xenopodis]
MAPNESDRLARKPSSRRADSSSAPSATALRLSTSTSSTESGCLRPADSFVTFGHKRRAHSFRPKSELPLADETICLC